ncbi:enoyl-CoA hydratase [Actinomadura sp. 7K507]|uniref:enoyl-CoA hydratase n=1 Tax=Actinomadura sp. 7K507 TaxID=2530365 RepID=UPI0010432060|nr:enoyl-CoA hydratase [Actinomadura sp. 7K507]TDC97608.1 enoyl-CoA hydratase [Actinomadura sp. 7K507]
MSRFLTYTTEDDGGIAVISLNRPRRRNAQNRGLLVELDEAFRRAEADDAVRVVVLRGEGEAFSSGHDLGSADDRAERAPGPGRHPTYDQDGGTRAAAERRMLQEWHYYFQNTRRWRDLRKITIASVHGPVISGGLMLMWACDLIVAARGTTFADVVGARLGMCGMEYFAHPWELGARRTKELLLTGDSIDADEAHRAGMVSKVFEPDRLEADTLAFARRLAAVPTVTALLIKESVNQTLDQQGFGNALAACFSLHSLNHAHWAEVNPDGLPLGTEAAGLPAWRDAGPPRPARKDGA